MNERKRWRGRGDIYWSIWNKCVPVWWPTFVYWLFHRLNPRTLTNHKQPCRRASFVRTCHEQQLNSLSSRYKMSVVTFKCLRLFLDQWTTKKRHSVTIVCWDRRNDVNLLTAFNLARSHVNPIPFLLLPNQNNHMQCPKNSTHMTSICVFMSLLL